MTIPAMSLIADETSLSKQKNRPLRVGLMPEPEQDRFRTPYAFHLMSDQHDISRWDSVYHLTPTPLLEERDFL